MANAGTARREDSRAPEHHVDANVRKVVRAILASRDMTGAELGEVMGFTANQIYPRLKGAKPFTVAEVATLSEYFGVAVQVFYDGPEALFRTGRQASETPMAAMDRGWTKTHLSIPPAIVLPLPSRAFARARASRWTDCQELESLSASAA